MTPAQETAERLDGAHDPCPTPLVWHEVLAAFEKSAGGQIVCADDAQIAVREFGDGPPLCFFPGLGGTPRLYALTAWVLQDQYRCLLIDHPVWKRKPPAKTLIHATADAWSTILQLYAPQGADVYAPSLGGQVALDLMARHPTFIRRCLLQGAWARRTLTIAERSILGVGTFCPGPVRRVPLWLSTQLQNHRRWFPPFDESRFGFLLHECGATRTVDFASRLRAAALTDLTPRLPAVSQPILLLRTEGEGFPIAAAMEHLRQRLANATEEWMPLCGQYPYLTHPHRLVKVIRNFFRLDRPQP